MGLKPNPLDLSSFSALTLLVGSFDPLKPIPDMTHNVFGGTLSLTQSINQHADQNCSVYSQGVVWTDSPESISEPKPRLWGTPTVWFQLHTSRLNDLTKMAEWHYFVTYLWRSRHYRHWRHSSAHWRRNCSVDHTATHTNGNSSIDTSVTRDTQRPWSFV